MSCLLTDEKRSEVVTLNLPGLPKLRVQSSLLRLIKIHKPTGTSLGDHALNCMVRCYFHDEICNGRLDNVQATAAAIRGILGNGWDRRATDVAPGNNGGNGCVR